MLHTFRHAIIFVNSNISVANQNSVKINKLTSNKFPSHYTCDVRWRDFSFFEGLSNLQPRKKGREFSFLVKKSGNF